MVPLELQDANIRPQSPESTLGTQVTSGARSDLKQATNLARHMVTECGMSDVVGPIFISDSPGGDFQKKIDSEVMRLLKEAYARVRKLLSKVSVIERGQLLLV
jgi:ATP-dependent Zn protease